MVSRFHGLVVRVVSCHAGDPGSNPPNFLLFFFNLQGVQNGRGGFLIQLWTNFNVNGIILKLFL